jgi:hypothetical protein
VPTITGRVVQAGQHIQIGPNDAFELTFFAEEATHSFMASVSPDGTFVLNPGASGIPHGSYQVIATWMDLSTGQPHDKLAGRFMQGNTPWKLQIPPTGDIVFDLANP